MIMNSLNPLRAMFTGGARGMAGVMCLSALLAGPGRGQGAPSVVAASTGLPDPSNGSVLPPLLNPPSPAYAAMNTLLGVPLLADDNLWADVPAEVAARLNLPTEGTTDHFASYRA